MNSLFRLLFFALTFSFLVGCAASNYRRGVNLIEKNQFVEGIRLLVEAEKEHPTDYKIKRELGVALFKMRKYDDAIEKLQGAKALNPTDSQTIFYLGLCFEGRGMLADAISEYRHYKNLGGSGKFRKEISKRIRQLTNERVSAEITKAIAAEQSLDVAAIPQNTVAVLYFKNLSPTRELDPLQKGLTQMLISDLSKVNKLQIVERVKLQKLLEELQLGESGLVDEKSAPRVGKLLGARKLVNGGFTELSDAQLRIDAALAETATSEQSAVDEVTGKVNALFQLEKQLALSVINDLGITLTTEEREAIQKIPTESLLAFIAYSKALDYEDRGQFELAKQEYQKAVELDPNFELAQEGLQEMEIAQSAAADIKLTLQQLESEFEDTAREEVASPVADRLIITGVAAQTGQAPQGDNDTREPVQEQTGAARNPFSTATIRIRIPLPDQQ